MHVAMKMEETGCSRTQRRELVDSATQTMVADEFYQALDRSLRAGAKKRARNLCWRWCAADACCRFLPPDIPCAEMDASVLVDSRVSMQKRSLQKYLADSGLKDVVKPGRRQYTLKHGKVLAEAIAAVIEPLYFRHKVEREVKFNLVVHYPDALFNVIDQQRRDQAVIEANDAARRQTATRRDARTVAAAGTKLQSNTADKHDGSESVKTAGIKAERDRRYGNNECFVCGKHGLKQWDCPQSQQSKAEKVVHDQSHG